MASFSTKPAFFQNFTGAGKPLVHIFDVTVPVNGETDIDVSVVNAAAVFIPSVVTAFEFGTVFSVEYMAGNLNASARVRVKCTPVGVLGTVNGNVTGVLLVFGDIAIT